MVGPFDEEMMGEAPVAPGVLAMLVVATVVANVITPEIATSGMIDRRGGMKEVSERTLTPRSVVLAEYNQLLKEFEASTIAQEELRRSEPSLASVASLHEVVTRGVEEGKRLEKEGGALSQPIGAGTAELAVDEASRAKAKYNARQRMIRVIAAKSLLREELAKVNPLPASVSAFRKAAYGDESVGPTKEESGSVVKEELVTGAGVLGVSEQPSMRAEDGGAAAATDVQRDVEPEEAATEEVEETVSEEEAMSVGDSDGETSDGFSGSGRSTSDGESLRSKGSRKRPADDSPERESTEVPRRGFPGEITRSEAGCRVHIPHATGSAASAMGSVGVTTDIVLSNTVNEVVDLSMVKTIGTVVVGGVIEMPGGVGTPATLPSIRDGEMVSEAMPMVEVGVGELRDVRVATTVAEIKTAVVIEVTLTEGGTGKVESGMCVSVSNAPEISMTTIESVVVVAQPTVEGSGDPGAGITADPDCLVIQANVELPFTMDLAAGETGVSFRVDIPTIFDPNAVERMGSLVMKIEQGDAGGQEIGARSVVSLPEARAGASTAVIRPLAGEGWGRDAHMVERIFRIIEGMEPPWVTVDVLEDVVLQFPTVNRETLLLVIMTVMMTQRRCVVRLTRAGLRLGPRVDRDGLAFVELDLDYAERYSNSH